MEIALFLVFPAMLSIAAIYDASTMTIPNFLTAILALLFPVVAFAAHWPVETIALHIGIGALAFAIGAGLFFAGVMGGGDVKLIAAAAIWLGLPTLWGFLLVTAIAGGALAAFALVARRVTPEGLSEAGWARWLVVRRTGLPYGVAIAVGGIFAWMNCELGAALLGRL
jgi:prepilin peptidase CpaA